MEAAAGDGTGIDGNEAMTRPPPQLARIAELERVYADEYPTAPREQRNRWAVEVAQYEADERHAIQNEQ